MTMTPDELKEIEGRVLEIRLTRGKVTLVDASDYEFLNQFKWCAVLGPSGIWYAARTHGPRHNQTYVKMHRLIMDALPDQLVDHKNGDGLDNKRINLRICTHQENARNQRKTRGTSQFKGVVWHKQDRKWQAVIVENRKNHYLGQFVDETGAAMVYDEAAKELFGEFACLNFPKAGV